MILSNTRNLIIVGAIVAVCGVAAVGYMNRPGRSANVAPYVAGQPASYSAAYSVPQPVPQTQAVYSSDGYYPTTQRPVYVRQQYAQPVTVQREYTEQDGRRVYRDEVYERPVVRHGRSKEHSVEIVAGTAGVGAVIGALAGGGKGAAIGAASGAGAGFAYDRLTHNH